MKQITFALTILVVALLTMGWAGSVLWTAGLEADEGVRTNGDPGIGTIVIGGVGFVAFTVGIVALARAIVVAVNDGRERRQNSTAA